LTVPFSYAFPCGSQLGKIMPAAPGGSAAVITEALERLNIRYRLAGATECYNKGQSTQIPVSLGIKTPSRFKRMLIVGKSKINA
ncbi:hypothetical protein RF182_07460, partial [Escherichia coli]|nr:hypothetical protein [Escherichia coli]